MPPNDKEKISVYVDPALKQRLEDFSFLLRVDMGAIITKGLEAALDSIAKSRGEAFQKALEVIASARSEPL